MPPIEVVLTLWLYGYMTEDEVVNWAWKQVALLPDPTQEMLDLASDGPKRCLKRAQADFSSRPAELTYEQEFSLRAVRVALDSDASLSEFSTWVSRRAMGEDLSDPKVHFAYVIDHLLSDCEDGKAAIEHARASLPAFMPSCLAVAGAFVPSGA